MDCVFCKIAKGEIPCQKIYEDSGFIAFLDIAPINYGHILVWPRQHYKNFFETPEEILADLIKVSKKIAKAMCRALNTDSFNLGLNTNRAAGQLVDHLHFHLIPRFEGDGLKHWPGRKYKNGEIEKYGEKIKMEINNYIKNKK